MASRCSLLHSQSSPCPLWQSGADISSQLWQWTGCVAPMGGEAFEFVSEFAPVKSRSADLQCHVESEIDTLLFMLLLLIRLFPAIRKTF